MTCQNMSTSYLIQIQERFRHRDGRHSPEILGYNSIRILVLEGQHAASGMLDQDDLGGAEELLRDHDASEGVHCGCTGL